VRFYSVTIDPDNAVAALGAEQDITVPGLKLGDVVFLNAGALTAGVGIGNVRVKAADTLSINWLNVKDSGDVNMTTLVLQIVAIGP
jgi:hypothetical protein